MKAKWEESFQEHLRRENEIIGPYVAAMRVLFSVPIEGLSVKADSGNLDDVFAKIDQCRNDTRTAK